MASVEPLYVTRVFSMVTDTPSSWGSWIGAWSGVTSSVEGVRFGALNAEDNPNTPALELQYYLEDQQYTDEHGQPAPSLLSVGPNNLGPFPEQILTIVSDRGTLKIYLPKLNTHDCVRTRLYVAVDGSTYHSRSDHNYTYSLARANITDGNCFGGPVVGPDLTPEQAMIPEHLARAALP